MVNISPQPGAATDKPPVAAVSGAFWLNAHNARFRLSHLETVGLYAAVQTAADAQVVLPGADVYRSLFTTPSALTGQILAGAANTLQVLEFDPLSTPAQGPRWTVSDITPAGLPLVSDVLVDPAAARVEIPPVWTFADQDDVVVAFRAGVTSDLPYSWDRNRTLAATPLSNAPTQAVGGGIINRILVLIGATSFTHPDPLPSLTIRWSDRFDFNEWTPSDVNLSGEIQLEGGSRCVGGGVTGFGVVAWTDRRMALLTETFDSDSVFQRRYIDGGRGLLANRAWCEADGVVWWFDEARVLNRYDGGRPVQKVNPLRLSTIERIGAASAARAYLVPNPEYSEIILWYPSAASADTALVYNYALDAWSTWSFPGMRTGWSPRLGVIPNLGVDQSGAVWQHDLDVSLAPPYLPAVVMPNQATVDAADVQPFDFSASTCLVTLDDDVASSTWRVTRILADHLPSVPDNLPSPDVFNVEMRAFGEASVAASFVSDSQDIVTGEASKPFRGEGKALQFILSGSQIKTVYRFAGFNVAPFKSGER